MADEYDEEYYGGGEQREDNGRTSIMDDLLRWMPDWSFRIDAFPSGCLTMSGALSLAVGMTFLLAAFMNVVLPHYDKIQYSVQTRCQIVAISKDDMVDDAIYHYDVKFPLPGIPGLREGEVLCWGSQACSMYTQDSRHDCFFNTEDHSLRFYTTMSGHHTLRLFSYVLIMIPFLIGACCCLIPASAQWNRQIKELTRDVQDMGRDVQDMFKGQQYDEGYDNRPYQGEMDQSGEYGGGARYPDYVQQDGGRGGGEGRGGGGMSGVSWVRMQLGV